MEIEKLISALEETLSYLQKSPSSDWAPMSVEETIEVLESAIAKARSSQPIDTKRLSQLFAPTGAIQEISIENDWGDEFLQIAEIIDEFTGNS